MQTSNGSGGFLDGGCTMSGGVATCDHFVSSGPGFDTYTPTADGTTANTLWLSSTTANRFKTYLNSTLQTFAFLSDFTTANILAPWTGTKTSAFCMAGDGTMQACGGGTGLSGMTAGQVPIAATATTATSSKALAGSGTGITTGPTSSTNGDIVTMSGTGGQVQDSGKLLSALSVRAISCAMGSPTGSALTTSETCYLTVPYACTITAWDILVDAGTTTVKVWKVATGTAVPTVANSINTSGVSISTGTAVRSTTLTDFTTTAIAANDILAFNLSAVATAKFASFELECTQ